VVEKSIAFGNSEQKREIVRVVTALRPDGTSLLHLSMRDRYRNYIQRMLERSRKPLKLRFSKNRMLARFL
jgi:hypothetical protein